jgi:hypothetical protein
MCFLSSLEALVHAFSGTGIEEYNMEERIFGEKQKYCWLPPSENYGRLPATNTRIVVSTTARSLLISGIKHTDLIYIRCNLGTGIGESERMCTSTSLS